MGGKFSRTNKWIFTVSFWVITELITQVTKKSLEKFKSTELLTKGNKWKSPVCVFYTLSKPHYTHLCLFANIKNNVMHTSLVVMIVANITQDGYNFPGRLFYSKDFP